MSSCYVTSREPLETFLEHENAVFFLENENVVFNGEQEKESIICDYGIEKSIPRDHHLSSLGMPQDGNL